MQSLNSQIDLLGRLINASDLRQKVISQNIANVNTPNYHRLDVEFESLLAQELQQQGTAAEASPVIAETIGLTARSDGNNVDIDQEIGHLNKNALMQQVYLHLLRSELAEMKMAMKGT
ncbi:MAG: flagellar basal body rod protein FlgB [Planctomycetaceae bacterium]|nr:flagellar basal body rod protein FlgB [Planctomycetaceae bacterium]MCA9065773.1 flagellar basal body rod protein FlgB [Planctomycetaceae bacterium]